MEAPDREVMSLLLIEPHSLMRGTVAAVARQLRLATVRECSSIEAGERLLQTQGFEALVLAWDDEGRGLRLVGDLRQQRFKSERRIPVVVMVERCDGDLMSLMKALDVRRIVLKPFKVKTLLDAIAACSAQTA